MTYHLIGIGGTSLSGVADALRAEGHQVTGSDARTTGHGPQHLPVQLDAVIYSEAITPGSAGWLELEAARHRGVKTQRRIEFIADRMKGHTAIAVAGAHGKSTTTAQIGWSLARAAEDPTVFIGADLAAFGGSARAGRGRWVVAEACEWNKQFLALEPDVLVLTSMDREHLDTYPGGEPEIIVNFRQLANQVRPGGFIVANADDPLIRRTLAGVALPIHWVGQSMSAGYRIVRVDQTAIGGLSVGVIISSNEAEQLVSSLIGVHHAINVVASFAVLNELGIARTQLLESVTDFPGLKRRFESYRDDDVLTIIDDYAHHPTELAATFRAARLRYPKRRIVAVFQPHLSERTTDLWTEFLSALQLVDQAIVAPTYEPAGRVQIPHAKTSQDLADALSAGGTQAIAPARNEDVAPAVERLLCSGDVMLTVGATDIWQVAAALQSWQPTS